MPDISLKFTYRLAQRSALPDGNLIPFLHTKCRRNMRSQILMSFLVSGVFRHEMEVFASNDQRSMHLGRDDGAREDPTTDRDLACKWAFFICNGNQQNFLEVDDQSIGAVGYKVGTDICALDSCLGGFETQTNILIPSPPTLSDSGTLGFLIFLIEKNMRLFLECAL